MKTVVIAIRSILTKIKTYPLARHTISTTFFSILGHSVGLFIPFFVAAWYGLGYDTDAFFLAYSLILFITNIFATAVEIGIVPFIAERKNKTPEQVGYFISAILVYSSIILVSISFLYILLGKYFLTLATRFDQSGIQLTYLLSLEILPLLILSTWSGILNGTLNAYKIFWLPAVSPAIRAICILGFTFIAKDHLGIHALAIGYIVGEGIRFLTAVTVVLYRRLMKLSNWLNMRGEVSQVFRILAFQIVSMAMVGLNPLIDRSMASWLGVGKVSLIEYSEKLFYIPTTLLSMGLLTVVLSHWSNNYYTDVDHISFSRGQSLKNQVYQVAKGIAIISFILTIALFIFRKPLVMLAYNHGNFTIEKIPYISQLFGIYLLGVVPYLVGHIFARGILVLKDTKRLAIVSTIKVLINVVGNIIFIIWLGLTGIVVSSVVTSIIALGLFYYFFQKAIKSNTQIN